MNTIKEMKKWIILIITAIIGYFLVNNFNVIISIIMKIIEVLSPFLIGAALAFILNIPMIKIENYLTKKIKNKNYKTGIRIISIIISLLILILIISLVAFLLIPELINNIKALIENIPILIDKVETLVIDLLDKYPEAQLKITEIFNDSTNTTNLLSDSLNYILNGIIGIITNLISGVIKVFTAVVFAIYLLSQKEYLLRATKKLINAYTKKEQAKKILEIGSLSNRIFSKFISGQCVEAVILGSIFFIVLSIFRFPYALLISILTTITALIPIFGALIAMIVGAILIAITDPFQAIIFIVLFQVIQQIEGNFIYPKVVGKSVGLPPMWTLAAISIGGSLFGILGMLIGLPIASIVYALLKDDVNKKLEKTDQKKWSVFFLTSSNKKCIIVLVK